MDRDRYKEGESEIFVSKTLVDEMQRMLMVTVGGRSVSFALWRLCVRV